MCKEFVICWSFYIYIFCYWSIFKIPTLTLVKNNSRNIRTINTTKQNMMNSGVLVNNISVTINWTKLTLSIGGDLIYLYHLTSQHKIKYTPLNLISQKIVVKSKYTWKCQNYSSKLVIKWSVWTSLISSLYLFFLVLDLISLGVIFNNNMNRAGASLYINSIANFRSIPAMKPNTIYKEKLIGKVINCQHIFDGYYTFSMFLLITIMVSATSVNSNLVIFVVSDLKDFDLWKLDIYIETQNNIIVGHF